MKPITDMVGHKALFFDDVGRYVGSVRIDYSKSLFYFKDRAYNFLPRFTTSFKLTRLFTSTRYYLYNINNPMPIVMNRKVEPVISSTAYNSIIKTNILKELNEISKGDFWVKLLTPKNIIFFGIIIAVIYYFATGGTIS